LGVNITVFFLVYDMTAYNETIVAAAKKKGYGKKRRKQSRVWQRINGTTNVEGKGIKGRRENYGRKEQKRNPEKKE
jgi:hypothetical protein